MSTSIAVSACTFSANTSNRGQQQTLPSIGYKFGKLPHLMLGQPRLMRIKEHMSKDWIEG